MYMYDCTKWLASSCVSECVFGFGKSLLIAHVTARIALLCCCSSYIYIHMSHTRLLGERGGRKSTGNNSSTCTDTHCGRVLNMKTLISQTEKLFDHAGCE